MERLVAAASPRRAARTCGPIRMAISRRGSAPDGGRPIHHIARSCAAVVSESLTSRRSQSAMLPRRPRARMSRILSQTVRGSPRASTTLSLWAPQPVGQTHGGAGWFGCSSEIDPSRAPRRRSSDVPTLAQRLNARSIRDGSANELAPVVIRSDGHRSLGDGPNMARWSATCDLEGIALWVAGLPTHFTGTAPLAAMIAAPAELRTNSMNLATVGGGVDFVTRKESRVST